MYEQLPPTNTPNKKYFLRIVLLILLIAATTYLFKTYDVMSYFKKDASAPAKAQAEVKPFDERQVREAFFLTRIASNLLQNDRNINSATDLLLLAQDRLDGMQGEKIDHAKSVLAADIAKLKEAKATDTQHLQDKLATLDKLIGILPLKHVQPAANTSKTTTTNGDQAMQSQNKWAVQNIVAEAKSIVKVSRKPAGNTPYSSDVAIDIKRAQFKLLIEQVRWALFYKEAAVYERSLKKAQEMLPEIFDVNSESVQQFAITLHELSQVNFNATLPNIQDSVNALAAILG